MNDLQTKILKELIERYPKLQSSENDIAAAFLLICDKYGKKGKLLIAGNGGSDADAEHIVGELMKGFVKHRTLPQAYREKLLETDREFGEKLSEKLQGALPAISLAGHPGLSTAYLNDVEPVLGFAQQVNGFGCADDLLFAISTSGNSKNILYAAVAAKAKGMKVIGLTGGSGGRLREYADVAVIVDEWETYRIQELHLPVYHALCLMTEEEFF